MILAREFRIKDKRRIENVKSQGKLIQSENFGVSYLKKESLDGPKFAFIISTKISKLAVQRNRINRLLHEGVRHALNLIPKGFDYVFLAKKSLIGRSAEEIIKEIGVFFKSVKITW